MPIEIERAQRLLDRQTTHPSMLAQDDPVRLLFELVQAYEHGDLQVYDDEEEEDEVGAL